MKARNVHPMKRILKLTCLGLLTFSLTGCAFTRGVAQGAYNNKAEKECRITSAANDSIHSRANSSCVGGEYEPATKIRIKRKKSPDSERN